MKPAKSYILFILFISLILFSGCPLSDDFEEGQFPDTPVNFESINSEFDDYNAAAPFDLYNEFSYLFSSNRNSAGTEYDIVNYFVEFHYLSETNRVYFNALDIGSSYYDSAVVKINTPSNEFGPFMMYSQDYLYDLFFFATDSSGNLDIYYLQHSIYNDNWDDPKPISKINTEYNEAYPTFNRNQDEMYFCSDANGVYNFYKVDLSSSTSVVDWLQTEDLPTWIACDVLNSSFNDKCPYINGNIMVFASDREGGYGGFDLYYSEYIDGNWSGLVNFGETINTEYDEFRPIVIYAHNYINDVMLFSSNRPGGLGGFDLYYVGIPKMIL
ncbi:MAG: hypothetical protein K8R31_07150 [Bacteroidales bacterium]|nr:hypothetical protein [Bacteroidales bacterium]